MRLNSARQAWHDAFYTNSDSAMFLALENSKLGVAIERTAKNRSLGKCEHMALAGRIQSAISTLPRAIQQYGHHLYSPLASVDEHDDAQVAVWSVLDLPQMKAVKREKAFWLVRAALFSYSRMVWGMADPLDTPAKVVDWVHGEHGAALDRTNWHRDWAEIYEGMMVACDRLDMLALAPVASTISELREVA